jgi:hypothetical protein
MVSRAASLELEPARHFGKIMMAGPTAPRKEQAS